MAGRDSAAKGLEPIADVGASQAEGRAEHGMAGESGEPSERCHNGKHLEWLALENLAFRELGL